MIYAKDYDLKDNIAKQKFIERFSDFFVHLSDLDRAVYLFILAKIKFRCRNFEKITFLLKIKNIKKNTKL